MNRLAHLPLTPGSIALFWRLHSAGPSSRLLLEESPLPVQVRELVPAERR